MNPTLTSPESPAESSTATSSPLLHWAVKLLWLVFCLSLFWVPVLLFQETMFVRSLHLAMALFCLGLFGLLTSQSIIKALISLEILFNAVNINFITFAHYTDITDVRGQIFALFVIAVAAAEVALGLALAIVIYGQRKVTKLAQLNQLQEPSAESNLT